MALVGSYYMGWREYGYNFDGMNAKRTFPHRTDVRTIYFGLLGLDAYYWADIFSFFSGCSLGHSYWKSK